MTTNLSQPAPQLPSLVTLPIFTGSVTFSKNHGEDWAAILLRDRSAVAVVADGAGGHPDAGPCGIIAGTTALTALATGPLTEMSVHAAVSAAHGALRTAVAAGVIRVEARTTLLIAAVLEGRAIFAKQGDSTIGIVADPASGTPATLVLADEAPPFLTAGGEVNPVVFSHVVGPGSVVALCSDGAAGGLLAAPPAGSDARSGRAVVDAARHGGSIDDATVALVSYCVEPVDRR